MLKHIILFFILQLLYICARGQVSESLDSICYLYSKEEKLSGTILIAKGDEILLHNGYGSANRTWNIANKLDTRFQIASLTKPITAALILKLKQEGKLSLEGKISDYLPSYPNHSIEKITIYQLLTHTSGIPDFTNLPLFKELSKNNLNQQDLMEIFAGEKLQFAPGSDFNYSNSGYFLLGMIAEKVTGKTYETLLHEKIFKPLGMKNSGLLKNDVVVDKLASGYELINGRYFHPPYQDFSSAYSKGGIYSTVNDLYLFDQALREEKILSDESKKILFTPNRNNYTCGWIISRINRRNIKDILTYKFDSTVSSSGDALKLIWHYGSNPGFNSLFLRIPEEELTIIILDNTEHLEDLKAERFSELVFLLFNEILFKMP